MLVYFAHPCFNEKQEHLKREFLEKLNHSLATIEHGRKITIIDPFLHTPNIEGDREAKVMMSETIKSSCIRLLEDCDVLLALTDGDDTGTAFEAGYAHCMNIPVILIAGDITDTANAMLLGAAAERIDHILEDSQMAILTHMLEWFYVSKKSFPPTPGNN
jgi:nucleoside 2-deoxyribosyltransferase